MTMIRAVSILVVMLGFAAEAHAAGCEKADAPVPANGQVSGTWWRAYEKWCVDCGGTIPPSVDGTQESCVMPAQAPATSAEAGHQMDEHIANAITAGVTGKISVGDAAGLVTLGVLGNALLTPRSKGTGTSTAGLQRAQEAERQRVVEANKAASSDRVLSQMLPEPGESSSTRSRSDGLLAGMLDTGEPARRAAPATQRSSLLEEMMTDPEPRATQPASGAFGTPAHSTKPDVGPDYRPKAGGGGTALEQAAGAASLDLRTKKDGSVSDKTEGRAIFDEGGSRGAVPVVEAPKGAPMTPSGGLPRVAPERQTEKFKKHVAAHAELEKQEKKQEEELTELQKKDPKNLKAQAEKKQEISQTRSKRAFEAFEATVEASNISAQETKSDGETPKPTPAP